MSRLRHIQGQGLHIKEALTQAGLLLRFFTYFACITLLITASALGILVAQQLRTVPDLAYLKNYHPVDAVEIYDKNDKLVCAINRDETRKNVGLDKISKFMKNAVLAAEDHHFYEHHGINFISISRALIVNTLAGKVVEGGSTITQQLVKNLFFPEVGRTFIRKLAEAFVAEDIESRYSKDEILTMYLNEIYFGNGAHGVEEAAEIYFGKPAAALTLSESAFLAALIKAPSINGNVDRRFQTLERQRIILSQMREYGYITDIEMRLAQRSGITFELQHNRVEDVPFKVYPYYVSYVLDQIHARYDDSKVRRSGLRVYTNLDPVAQQCAEETVAKQIKVAPVGVDEEALVAISVKDGAVRAIVGGAGDYWKNQWNCATNAHTVGSAFKPFVYLTAFLQGALRRDSIIEDSPITVNQIDMTYSPKNYDGKFQGKITVRQALARSRNTCAIRVAQKVGVSNILETAKRLGINAPIQDNLSIALGSCAVSPLDMAAAYGTLARGGIEIKPWTIRHVDDLSSNVIESFEPPITCRVLPEEPVAQLVDVLRDVVTSGTGTLARLPDRQVAGKTGTADQARDLWFIGFTPDMVTAVWGGNKNNQAIADKHVTGGSVMCQVFHNFNVSYYAKTPTPKGELIADKAKDTELQMQIHEPITQSIHYSHLPRRHRSSTENDARIPNPTNGVVLRNSKGVTDYSWGR